jgi:cysteine synthase A
MPRPPSRAFINDAVFRINADFRRSSDTHLLRVDVPAFPGVQLYFKDESTHITGSLKHRLARSLFLYALCNGHIGDETTIVEASSGSTAVSEAYFARLLGLPFVAVMPRTTSAEKIALIRTYGAQCHLVEDPRRIYDEAERIARETGGHYMDQFTFAERATDWRGNNNIAESVYEQMAREPHPIPAWIVCGAGTGGTSATLGRYARYGGYSTRICVVDPERSVFFDYFRSGDRTLVCEGASGIEGIGRPRVEPSFLPSLVDRMIRVENAASLGGVHFLREFLGRRCGPSTGTNLFGACALIAEMATRGQRGSVVTIIGDLGERYNDTCFNPEWLRWHECDVGPHVERFRSFFEKGEWDPAAVQSCDGAWCSPA